jgi:large subunit ribosomal protein L28
MSKVCEICGKKPMTGNSIVRHGLKKAKGGIGLHTTGITRRRFMPNLQNIRVKEGGSTVRRTVCTECIRAGRITKP